MNALLIAIALMLGIISSSNDLSNLSQEQQQEIEQIVIEDHQQM